MGFEKHKRKQLRETKDGIKYKRNHIDYKRGCTKDNLHRIKEAACHKAASFQFARHGRALTGESPEHAQVVGNV